MTKLMRSNPSHIDYGDFKGLIASNPNFVPCNLDGIAERNGRFLVMEWKRPGEQISLGQKLLLQAMAKIPQIFTVVIINGNTDEETVINSFWLLTTEGKPYKRGTGLESFKTFYKEWYKWVNDEK